jgi:hypothetical protein
MKINPIITFVFIFGISIQNPVLAQNEGGLKGGSLFSSAIGSHSLSVNPANFWTSRKSGFSILLPVSLQLNNNSVSTTWLNSYLLSGKTLDDQSVESMLGEIPESGLSVNGNGQLMLFGLSYKWLAVYIGGSAQMYGNIPKSLFHSIFQGVEFDKPIDLTDTRMNMQAVLPVSLVLSGKFGKSLYAGLGVKGLLGLAYFSMNGSGGVTSHKDKFSGDGNMKIHYNLGDYYIERDSLLAYSTLGKFTPNVNGRGVAIDLGLTKVIDDNWTLGFSVQNIMGTLDWDETTSHKQLIQFDVDIHSDEFEEISDFTESQQDSLLETIITKDETSTIDTLTTKIPMTIELESEYIFGTRFLLFNSISYAGESTIYPESQLEISGGFRWLIHSRIPISVGVTHNSRWGMKWGGGIGLHFNHMHLDLFLSQNEGFMNDAKGFSVNLINYFHF